MTVPMLYGELASWWHLLSAPEDYAEEAAFVRDLLEGGSHPPARTLLELGSGGGNNASHLKARFEMTLVDLSPGMIEAGRALNPECEHVVGDMRSVRLGRLFDAVFIHDAISYMRNLPDLRAALETAAVHCRPEGAAVFVPDYVRETFVSTTTMGGHEDEARAVRYLEWTHEPEDGGEGYVADFAILLREGRAPARLVHDRHEFGLFGRAEWLEALAAAGFIAHAARDPYGREVFAGIRR